MNGYPMSSSMGEGELAFRLSLGKPARLKDLVSIFDYNPSIVPSTIGEQESYFQEWLRSVGRK
jgi:hypothetical protein